MSARDLTALVHLVGFATGIVLYAMLGVMTRRVTWNAGAMPVAAARDFEIPYALAWIAPTSYAALEFLSSVVLRPIGGTRQAVGRVRVRHV